MLASNTQMLVHNTCGAFVNQMPGALAGELSAADRLGFTVAWPGPLRYLAERSSGQYLKNWVT